MDDPVHLTLYVTRACAIEATKNVIKALGSTKEDVADLKIVDVGDETALTEEENIFEVPCLKVERGEERSIFVNNLSDTSLVERALQTRWH